MRFQQIFTNSQAAHDFYSSFEISQGPLYHYTTAEAIESISDTNQLWISRADSFLDTREVNYGTEVLLRAVEAHEAGSNDEMSEIVSAVGEALADCYILSLTINPANAYLAGEYGDQILELPENFPILLRATSWHTQPVGDGSFKLFYFTDLYKLNEGFVIYDNEAQTRLATKAVTAFFDLLTTDYGEPKILNQIDIVRILTMCIVLFKEKDFEREEEYRVMLHRQHSPGVPNFEETHSYNGRERKIIKATNPELRKELTVSTYDHGH